jgi:DNA-binding YbaB/EbfC family protein
MAKGYKAPKIKNPMGTMQQIQQLQEQLATAQAQLAAETVTATAGGGAVKITLTGDQRCRAVEIDPALLADSDVEMLQDLILTAINQAQEAAQKLAAERLGPLAGGIPGLF